MARKVKDNPDTFPWLGRKLLWVDKPGSAMKLIWILGGICLLLALADFTYSKYGHFSFEKLPAFYGIFGFIAFSCVIFGAGALRVLIKRPENYYKPHVVDTEDYPPEELEEVSHDGT